MVCGNCAIAVSFILKLILKSVVGGVTILPQTLPHLYIYHLITLHQSPPIKQLYIIRQYQLLANY